jgi:hypothetical protein
MLMKRFTVLCGSLILVAITSAISAGWLLAHPVQARIGNPPVDLNAQPVTFPSDSGANVHGWWCPIQNPRGMCYFCPAFARIV